MRQSMWSISYILHVRSTPALHSTILCNTHVQERYLIPNRLYCSCVREYGGGGATTSGQSADLQPRAWEAPSSPRFPRLPHQHPDLAWLHPKSFVRSSSSGHSHPMIMMRYEVRRWWVCCVTRLNKGAAAGHTCSGEIANRSFPQHFLSSRIDIG